VGAVTALAAFAGAMVVAGLVLLVAGLWPVEVGDKPRVPQRWPHGLTRRVLLGGAAAVAVGLLTRWPAVALLAGALGWAGPSLLGGTARSRSAIARIEAIASWTEMLQGLLAAAAGLEQAIIASLRVAPEPILEEVRELASRLRDNQPLRVALGRFAEALDEPTADLVVAALRLAADPTQKVGQLRAQLAELATATRETATMRLRVETGRARIRSAARMVTVITSAFTLALLLLNRAYLAPFARPAGQLVLLLVGACYAAAYWLLARMARVTGPERLVLADATEHTGQEVAP
jgi:tight adherence protein B